MASSRGRWASPERTVVWTEPPPKAKTTTARRAGAASMPTKVAVVYYLSRNGQLDHPHFMEIALSSPQDGLCLRDVLDRLNVLRGAGMAETYSWSSKRSYKNGYVWHDLTADDPVHPANGNEYVLKGSQLLALPVLAPHRPWDGSASSSSSTSSCEPSKNRLPAASARAGRRKNWSSFDLGEYRVAAAVQMGAADAATQTDERRGRRLKSALEPPVREELGIDQISPPPSSSSPDTLETLIQHDARLALANSAAAPQTAAEVDARRDEVGVISGGRMRASAVLMQLISCGSIPAPAKRDSGAARYGAERRLPRGRSDLSSSTGTATERFSGTISSVGLGMEREYFSGSLVETKKTASDDHAGVGVGMEREYFSGSLVETKKTASEDRAGHGELGALKRSSSYNADRSRDMNMVNTTVNCKLELEEEEVDGVRARCIPAARRPSKSSNKKSPASHVSSRRSNQPETRAALEKKGTSTVQAVDAGLE